MAIGRAEGQNVSQSTSSFGFDPKLSRTTDTQGCVSRHRLIEPDLAHTHGFTQSLRDLEILHEFAGLFVNIAGPEAQNYIAFLRDPSELSMEMVSNRYVRHGRMSMLANRIRHRCSSHSGDRPLASRVYIGDMQNIGSVEGRAKLISKGLRSRIAVWLEHHYNALPTHTSRHGQGRFYLRGMMPIIIEHLYVFVLEFRLEATARSAKSGQCLCNARHRHA